jgi:hypothetical protein
VCWSSTKQTSSLFHWKLTCSRPDIAKNLWVGVKQQSLTITGENGSSYKWKHSQHFVIHWKADYTTHILYVGYIVYGTFHDGWRVKTHELSTDCTARCSNRRGSSFHSSLKSITCLCRSQDEDLDVHQLMLSSLWYENITVNQRNICLLWLTKQSTVSPFFQ